MRVNMDSSIVFDPRFKMLAKRLGITTREVIGSCFLLWLHCYQSRSECLSVIEANASAEVEHFAEGMIAVGLADAEGADRLTIHGVRDRIRFLSSQASRGRKGGKASAQVRQRHDVATKNGHQANGVADAKQTLPQNRTTAQAYTPTPTLTPSLKEEEVKATTSPALSTTRFEDFVTEWNAAVPFSKIRKMTPSRKETLSTRLKDRDWADNYIEALSLIKTSSFFRGENDRRWKIDPDFFLRPDTVNSILEGKHGVILPPPKADPVAQAAPKGPPPRFSQEEWDQLPEWRQEQCKDREPLGGQA